MFGLKERPAHVLIRFWCDYDNKNFLRFRILADILVWLIFATCMYSISKIW